MLFGWCRAPSGHSGSLFPAWSCTDVQQQEIEEAAPDTNEEVQAPKQPCLDEPLNIAGHWQLFEPLKLGSVTDVQLVVNTQTEEEAVLRTEDKDSEIGGLEREAYLLRKASKCGGKTGLATFFHFGVEADRHVLVTQLLGPSLEQKFEECGRGFSHKTVANIAVQLLYRLECVHDLGVLHRALQPGCVRLGLGADSETLFLTDFTQAKVYKNGNQHIPYKEHGCRRSGSPGFSSVAEHLGAERSRRDDLESLAFMLVYFLRGSLPWETHQDAPSTEEVHADLGEAKRSMDVQQVAAGLRPLEELFLYCRSLWFEASPNYHTLRRKFRKSIAIMESSEGKGMFDWSSVQRDDRFESEATAADDVSTVMTGISSMVPSTWTGWVSAGD
uniref:Casein kinase I n=1 Tax=Alexandrium andersonii TaxID=327968 RepID=A0A7S2AE41_9DINO|mmetsp:Transcript_103378/g.232086  ORF Transcript_103378/g.232086 Transcript_103378/m.232086 type:complete len:386 (+) Transcript_103378:49-1206(+)